MVAKSRGCCTQCGNLEGKTCGEVQGYLNLCKHSLKPSDNDVCARDSSPPTSHVRQTWYGRQASSAQLVSKTSHPQQHLLPHSLRPKYIFARITWYARVYIYNGKALYDFLLHMEAPCDLL